MDLAGSQESSEEKPRSPPQQQQHPHPHPYPHSQPHPTIMPAPTPTPVPTPTAMPPPPAGAVLTFSSAAADATPNFPVPAPAATVSSQQEPKLKLATSGNGGASPLQQQQAAEAREILRLNAPQQQQQQTAASSAKIARPGLVRYRDCQRNHAATIGGHALDGCGEFMPAGPDGSPNALRCAACDCHRNFHRLEAEGEPPLCECRRAKRPALALAGPSSLAGGVGIPQQQQQLVAASPATPATAMTMTTLALATPATAMQQQQYQQARGPAMALSGGPASSDEQEGGMSAHGGSPSAMKKRFRTKFTGEQKDKMCAFADKLGWRMQKHDEAAVQEFCASVGVKRHVLKVWMHNNKHTLGKKP